MHRETPSLNRWKASALRFPLTRNCVRLNYPDTYTFDLNGNQITDVHTGPGSGASATTTNTYNGDDQLTDAQVTGGTDTRYDYDPNGSQIDVKVNGTVTSSYSYDVRNKMVGFSNGTTSASYVYDDAGNRVAETSGTTTTYYLTDIQNPTGYAQPVEAHQGSAATAPTETYLIGDRVFGQADSSGNVNYLLIDGHGSTQQITNASGTVTAAMAYTAYGSALNFNPAAIGSAYLFGGDAIYDPVSGLYMHGDGTRDSSGFRFIQADTQGNGSNSDPISLHRYLYAGADPINAWDPSGHDLTELLVDMGIDSVLNSAVSFALKPAIGYVTSALASALIPQSALNAIENALPNVGIIGAGLALNVAPSGGFGASFEGALEGVYSSHTNHGALFLADTEKLGLIGGDPGAVNFVVGLGWNVADSEDYTDNKYGVSFPFAGLPSKIQSRIQADLTNRLGSFVSPFLSQLSAGASALDSAFPGYSSGLINSIESDLPSYTAGILHFLDKCEATVLTNGDGVEVVLGYNALEEANSSESARYTGAGIVHASATQLYPSEGNVPFE
jgi:RHS repeat-associated protein